MGEGIVQYGRRQDLLFMLHFQPYVQKGEDEEIALPQHF